MEGGGEGERGREGEGEGGKGGKCTVSKLHGSQHSNLIGQFPHGYQHPLDPLPLVSTQERVLLARLIKVLPAHCSWERICPPTNCFGTIFRFGFRQRMKLEPCQSHTIYNICYVSTPRVMSTIMYTHIHRYM